MSGFSSLAGWALGALGGPPPPTPPPENGGDEGDEDGDGEDIDEDSDDDNGDDEDDEEETTPNNANILPVIPATTSPAAATAGTTSGGMLGSIFSSTSAQPVHVPLTAAQVKEKRLAKMMGTTTSSSSSSSSAVAPSTPTPKPKPTPPKSSTPSTPTPSLSVNTQSPGLDFGDVSVDDADDSMSMDQGSPKKMNSNSTPVSKKRSSDDAINNEDSNDGMDVEKDGGDSMDIDVASTATTKQFSATLPITSSLSSSTSLKQPSTPPPAKPKFTIQKLPTKPDPSLAASKAARENKKRTQNIKRILGVTFTSSEGSSLVYINDDSLISADGDVTLESISGILAVRLAIPVNDGVVKGLNPPTQSSAVGYLHRVHSVVVAELRSLDQGDDKTKSNSSGSDESNKILKSMYEEIKLQVVNYTATSLMMPELFEMAAYSSLVLLKELAEPNSNICIANGSAASFYTAVVDELFAQGSLDPVIIDIVTMIIADLKTTQHDILSTAPVNMTTSKTGLNALQLIKSLTSLCTSKKSTSIVTDNDAFLAPSEKDPKANMFAPAGGAAMANLPPQFGGGDANQQQILRQMFAVFSGGGGGTKNRSGPGVESLTVLGLVLRCGVPLRSANLNALFAGKHMVQEIELGKQTVMRTLAPYHNARDTLVMHLLKGGSASKVKVLKFISDVLVLNVNAAQGEGYRDATKVSSNQFMYNLSYVLLKLCEPFSGSDAKSIERRKTIDCDFVSDVNGNSGVFKDGEDGVARLGKAEEIDNDAADAGDAGDATMSDTAAITPSTASAPSTPKPDKSPEEYNFITHTFFYTARVLHLGIFPVIESNSRDHQRVQQTVHQLRTMGRDVSMSSLRSEPNFSRALAQSQASDSLVLIPTLLNSMLLYYSSLSSFLLPLTKEQLRTIPEHFIDDILALLMHVSNSNEIKPEVFIGVDFGEIFKLVVKLLSPEHHTTVRNYNLRANLGDILFNVFLPTNFKKDDGAYYSSDNIPYNSICNPSCGKPWMLSSSVAQDSLAPSLLLLFGEIENTGFYEKQDHRSKVCSILKYLWESPQHRKAFKKISENVTQFVVFANGIINETNSLISIVMQKLPKIKVTQDFMKDSVAWNAKPKEEIEEMEQTLRENSHQVKNYLLLSNKTLKMFAYLNNDKSIRTLFLLPELVQRLADMLINVVSKLVGSKGLELKVDNPAELNFYPRVMLTDCCEIFLDFAPNPEFHTAIAQSGYYNNELLLKLVSTCKKLNIISLQQGEDMGEMVIGVQSCAESVYHLDYLTELADELVQDQAYVDVILGVLMTDPVRLPTSNNYVQRSTIQQQLLNDKLDPFNRLPLTIDMVEDAVELKEEIRKWMEAEMAKEGWDEGLAIFISKKMS